MGWHHHQVARDVIGAVEGLHSGIVIQLELQEWKRNNLMLWQPGNRVLFFNFMLFSALLHDYLYMRHLHISQTFSFNPGS